MKDLRWRYNTSQHLDREDAAAQLARAENVTESLGAAEAAQNDAEEAITSAQRDIDAARWGNLFDWAAAGSVSSISAEGAKIKIRQFNFELALMVKFVKEVVYLNAHYSVFWGIYGLTRTVLAFYNNWILKI